LALGKEIEIAGHIYSGFTDADIGAKLDHSVVDAPVPWIPRNGAPRSATRLVHFAEDPFWSRDPHHGYEIDVALEGDSNPGIPLPRDALKAKMRSKTKVMDVRRAKIADRKDEYWCVTGPAFVPNAIAGGGVEWQTRKKPCSKKSGMPM
jgi:hypothetical protein